MLRTGWEPDFTYWNTPDRCRENRNGTDRRSKHCMGDQGIITLLRSTDSSLPIIRMDAKLLSWQMYSNSSSPEPQRM